MRIFHVFDRAIPLHSGYTFRSRAILREQQKQGWVTTNISSIQHAAELTVRYKVMPFKKDVEGTRFYRTILPTEPLVDFALFKQWAVVNGLVARLVQVAPIVWPKSSLLIHHCLMAWRCHVLRRNSGCT